MTSEEVIKDVSRKLKYYFQIKRLEDGFDLSGVDCPKMDHPPIRARPILQYERLKDRSLKHYFNDSQIKMTLTQMKAPEDSNDRQKSVKKLVRRYMKNYQYKDSSLPDYYYIYTDGKRVLRPEAQGFLLVNSQTNKSNPGYPVLRSVPTPQMTKGEITRLVNTASQLIVSTEYVGSRDKTGSQQSLSASSSVSRLSTASYSRPSTAKKRSGRQYDKNGRRVQKTHSTDGSISDLSRDNDAHSRGESHDRKTPKPPASRPLRTTTSRSRSRRKQENMKVEDLPLDKQPRAWDLEVCEPEDRSNPVHSFTSDERDLAQSGENNPPVSPSFTSEDEQEEEELTDNVQLQSPPTRRGTEKVTVPEPSQRVVNSGEHCLYRVYILTGDKPGAGTQAPVYLVLYGEKGKSQKIPLQHATNHKVPFQKGQEDTFDVEAFFVGSLQWIEIGHTRDHADDYRFGWFLESLVVEDLARCRRYTFICQSWLSVQADDHKTIRQFPMTMMDTFKPSAFEDDEDVNNNEKEPVEVTPGDRGGSRGKEGFHMSIAPASHPEGPVTRAPPTVSTTSGRTHTSTATVASPSIHYKVPSQGSEGSSTFTSKSSKASASAGKSSESGAKSSQSGAKSSRSGAKSSFSGALLNSPYQALSTGSKVSESHSQASTQRRLSHGSFGNKSTDTQHSSTTSQRRISQGSQASVGSVRRLSQGSQASVGLVRRLSQGSQASVGSVRRLSQGSRASVSSVSKPTQLRRLSHESRDSSSKSSPVKTSGPNNSLGTKDKPVEKSDLLKKRSIHVAARHGDLELVKEWIAQYPNLISEVDERGWTILHIASDHGCLQVLRWLLGNGADVHVVTPTGYTPVHLAALNGQTKCIKELFQHGGKTNELTIEKHTPLHLAAMKGHVDSVRLLVDHRAALDLVDLMGRTPLDMAEQYNHRDIVEILQEPARDRKTPSLSSTSSSASLRAAFQSTRTPDSSDDEGLYDSELLKKKHQEEVEEKRRLYEEQHTRMERQQTSFLDSIRNELDSD